MNLFTSKLCLIAFIGVDAALAFSNNARVRPAAGFGRTRLMMADEPTADNDDEGEDWRAFRAKLVMSESPSSSPQPSSIKDENSSEDSIEGPIIDDSDLDGFGALFSESSISGFTPLDPSQWAYDSGKVIEKGAVILGGVEQDFGFGLRQQYFHKAVILVLDHDENTFTKGIILNRPSDRMMDDDTNEGLKWRVWFGGDVQGLDSIMPEIVCLHSLKSEEAREASNTVMKDIQWTSFTNAKKLVKKGVASGPDDFWLFAGYAGWGPSQLAGELDRKSWYMCATDSQTLLKELSRQSKGVDPRDAGLETWDLLMDMIGRGETAEEKGGSFDDLMLKEWSQANLVKFDFDYGEVGLAKNLTMGGADVSSGTVDTLMKEAAKMALAGDLSAGTLLRGSSADRSPFLLKKQEMHHSLVLVILEDDKVSLGCMLNHPATKGYEVGTIKTGVTSIPIRYGGDYAIKGQSPLMWLHCSQKLKDSGLGSSVGDKHNEIWKCTQDEATEAILYNIAKPEDFLVMSGVCVWPKFGESGIADEVKRGSFEVVDNSNVEEVFATLLGQEILTKNNLAKNIAVSNEAWQKGAGSQKFPTNNQQPPNDTLTLGIGEGFDEDDDTVVFNSDKKVSELANDALKKWVATFLLGSPTLS